VQKTQCFSRPFRRMSDHHACVLSRVRQTCIETSLNSPFGSQQIPHLVVGQHLQWRHCWRHRGAHLRHLSDSRLDCCCCSMQLQWRAGTQLSSTTVACTLYYVRPLSRAE